MCLFFSRCFRVAAESAYYLYVCLYVRLSAYISGRPSGEISIESDIRGSHENDSKHFKTLHTRIKY
jgi:hypothetical protein